MLRCKTHQPSAQQLENAGIFRAERIESSGDWPHEDRRCRQGALPYPSCMSQQESRASRVTAGQQACHVIRLGAMARNGTILRQRIRFG